MKIAKVTWRDSNMYVPQIERDYPFEVIEIESVGFIISRDKDKIVLTGDNIGEDGRRIIVIPKENIVEVRILKEK